jgi:hypothetical protein
MVPDRTLDRFGAEEIFDRHAVRTGKGFFGCKLAKPIGQPTSFGHCHHGPKVICALRRFPGAAVIDAGATKKTAREKQMRGFYKLNLDETAQVLSRRDETACSA